MRRVNDLSGDCCLWGINAQEESILGVKLVGWKIQEEKVLGGKNSGERWGPAFWSHQIGHSNKVLFVFLPSVLGKVSVVMSKNVDFIK